MDPPHNMWMGGNMATVPDFRDLTGGLKRKEETAREIAREIAKEIQRKQITKRIKKTKSKTKSRK